MAEALTPPTQSPNLAKTLEPGNLTVHHGGYRLVGGDGDQALRRQPFWRLYWTANSGPRARWPSGGTVMHGKVAVLVPPMLPFARTSSSAFISVHFFFSTTWKLPLQEPSILPLDSAAHNLLVHYSRSAERSDGQAMARWATAAIAASVATLPPIPPGPDPRIQELVQEWQRMQPSQLPDNTEAGTALNMSSDGFARRFRRATGVTPGAWRSQFRLMTAARLLRQGHPITFVVTTCGWRSRSHFSAEFRKIFGCPPGEWQRRLDG